MTRLCTAFLVFLFTCLSIVHAFEGLPHKPPATITVGVRGDARPFSYITTTRANEDILAGYGGYMIEICRRVLSEMVVNGPFQGYQVEPIEVTAESRLPDLDSGRIDMLCGPDSITLSRLYKYNTSHPVFLSGITYVTVEDDMFPRTRYCGPIIGLVANTTAETEGLRKIADSDELQLYDSALESFLSEYADLNEGSGIDVDGDVNLFIKGMKNDFGIDSESSGGQNKVPPQSVKTAICPNGFDKGPVVFYDTHEQGIADLCEGKILFYVGDIDIISDRIGNCRVITRRETLTREAYGVYFRRPQDILLTADSETPEQHYPDSELYSEFNNVLIRKMQTAENILDYEFHNEFKNESPTEDLQSFFDSYKFVVDY